MLQYLLPNGRQKSFWLIIAMIAMSFNLMAIYMQYGVGLEPCVKCIDQRISLYLVTISALSTTMFRINSPYFSLMRIATLLTIIYATYLAWGHYDELYNPENMFSGGCAFDPNLPQWLPLHEWLPSLFGVKGICGKAYWKLLDIELVKSTFIACSLLLTYTLVGMTRLMGVLMRKKRG